MLEDTLPAAGAGLARSGPTNVCQCVHVTWDWRVQARVRFGLCRPLCSDLCGANFCAKLGFMLEDTLPAAGA
jgi:hypothetical protein